MLLLRSLRLGCGPNSMSNFWREPSVHRDGIPVEERPGQMTMPRVLFITALDLVACT
jgi:hypothetical protein